MERMTCKQADGSHIVTRGAAEFDNNGALRGPAVERLAAFENVVETLEAQHTRLAAELEALKARGRMRGATGQQLLAQKITCSTALKMLADELEQRRE